MLDLTPATDTLASIVDRVRDEQLNGRTPCSPSTLADLLDHVDGLAMAFTAAAEKSVPAGGSQPPRADGSRLNADWRPRIRDRLARLAAAWQAPSAWEGMTEAGGAALPGQVAGLVALNEVIVHGWDIAVSSGQPFSVDEPLIQAAMGFVQETVKQNPRGSPGLFGPPLSIPEDAPLLDRLIALTGRDPAWSSHPPAQP